MKTKKKVLCFMCWSSFLRRKKSSSIDREAQSRPSPYALDDQVSP